MGLLDPEEVCCSVIGKSPIDGKLNAKQLVPKNTSSNGTSAQDERIKKLEIQMSRLSEDVEKLKNQQCNSTDAIQRAINRGVCGLGGRFKILNDISVPSCPAASNYEISSRSSCCSSCSTTSSPIRVATPKDNEHSPAKEHNEKLKEDKNNGCGQFVLG